MSIMTQDEKEQWLCLADKFFSQGDFRAMRACAREILAMDAEDADGLALLAQASLYLGEAQGEMLVLIRQILQKQPEHLRTQLVLGEFYAGDFALPAEIRLLHKVIEQAENLTPGELTSSLRALWQRAECLLADAYYLAAMPNKAAEALFAASRLGMQPIQQAELYSKGLFMTNYYVMSVEQVRKLHWGYDTFFADLPAYSHVPERALAKRKLRIGYISADFRLHAAAYFMTPFLRDYDKNSFVVYCYAAGSSDVVTKRLRQFSVVWRDIRGLTPREAAKRIWEDKVDILVDFSGHTQHTCLPVLSYRPAPVQISGIGYMNTTGLHTVNYFLSDMCCLPKAEPANDFTEAVLRLPHCHLCYVPETVRKMPSVEEPSAYGRNGYITFGSFNNFAKVTDDTLLLWRAILERVPASRLVIKGKICSIPSGRAIVSERLLKLGMDVSCIELRPYSPDYLEQYRDIDIALDSMPYNGGLTTCEALFMGVPVISLRGHSHGSRFGASILENVGLAELVAEHETEYVAKAVRLALSPQNLSRLHACLRANMQESSLMDAKQYMHNIEALYHEIWDRYSE